jgi:succinoglycan biosynthesis transport protein ExoP
LVAGEQMQFLIRQLRESYDFVVIDSPPVLGVSESRLLAPIADEVLFVVKWNTTRRDIANNALSVLRNSPFDDHTNIATISVVVTQVDLKKHARYLYGDATEAFVKYKKYYSGKCGA